VSEPISLAAPSDLELCFEVDLDDLPWDRRVFVGLANSAKGSESPRFGVELFHTGGAGHALRSAAAVWGRLPESNLLDPRNVIEEKQPYACRLLRTAEGRLALTVERLAGGSRATESAVRGSFVVARPPSGRRNERLGPEDAAEPVPAGDHRLVIAGRGPSGHEAAPPARRHALAIRRLSVRALPADR
jgi:hypothetical protein